MLRFLYPPFLDSQISIAAFLSKDNYSCSMILVSCTNSLLDIYHLSQIPQEISKDEIQLMITDQVVEKLQTVCPDCSRANLDNPQIGGVPPLVIYRARLGGTHKHDSDDLADLLEKWTENGLNVSLGEEPSPSQSTVDGLNVSVGEEPSQSSPSQSTVDGLNVSLGEEPSQSSPSQSTGELVWLAVGFAAGLFSMATGIVTPLAVWRCRRAAKRKRKAKTEKLVCSLTTTLMFVNTNIYGTAMVLIKSTIMNITVLLDLLKERLLWQGVKGTAFPWILSMRTSQLPYQLVMPR